jgi:hypothetical protein
MNKILLYSNVNVSEHFLATSWIFLYSKTRDKKKFNWSYTPGLSSVTADIGESWGSASWISLPNFS